MQEFGFGLHPETLLWDLFTNRINEVAEEGAERELSTLAVLEHTFCSHQMNCDPP